MQNVIHCPVKLFETRTLLSTIILATQHLLWSDIYSKIPPYHHLLSLCFYPRSLHYLQGLSTSLATALGSKMGCVLLLSSTSPCFNFPGHHLLALPLSLLFCGLKLSLDN